MSGERQSRARRPSSSGAEPGIRVTVLVRLEAQGEPHLETKHLQMVGMWDLFVDPQFSKVDSLKDSTLAAINVSEIFN